MDANQIQSIESKDWCPIKLLFKTKADKAILMLLKIIENQKSKCK
jgi:hypothetical protein